MKQVEQTKLGSDGNCFEACIASLLDCAIEEVPDLGAYEEDNTWLGVLNDWLERTYGLGYLECRVPHRERDEFWKDKNFYHIIIGPTSLSQDIHHAVVGRKGRMLWDPHPEHIGILDEPDSMRIGVIVSQC